LAELPEIAKLAGQMRDTLRGKTIDNVEILQEKCANIAPGAFQSRAAGARVEDVWYKGKWIFHRLSNGEHILLSLGMGADILYFEDAAGAAEKYQIKVLFRDLSGYAARFWWFGKFLLVSESELESEPNTKNIAIDPFDARFTPEYFSALLRGKRKAVKAFLMDQKNVGGIGNMYMHDILFRARLHPRRKISDMDEGDIRRLYDSITGILSTSRSKGAFA
jgi:formamidopyrimidine-DNA glycosylase